MIRAHLILLLTILSLAAPAVPAALAADSAGFRWVDHPDEGTCDLLYDGKPALRYMYAFDRSTPKRAEETFKVYHHVFGPGTGDLITKGPGGLYTHHRGLFFGYQKTRFDGRVVNFWECPRGFHLRHVRFLDRQADRNSASMTSEISWNEPDDKPVVNEIRSIRIARVDGAAGAGTGRPAWQIDWSTKVTSRRGEIELDGDRQHGGFQFRAPQSIADEKSATYLRPKGFPTDPQSFEVDDRKDPGKHVNLGWLAMIYTVKGTRYTVAYLEDPSLPKPSRYSERSYGRFGAFFKSTIGPDRPLALRYRVIVTEGAVPSREQIQAEYDRFVSDLAHSKT